MTTSDAHPDDLAIAALVDTFFAAFTSGADLAQRMDALRAAFLPGAVIVRTCGDLAVYDVEGFLAPRAELLTSGRLVGFREWAEDGRTDRFGDVAQHVCPYAKEGVLDGAPFTGRGFKTLQFVRTGSGWRISAAAWDDERPV
jgi:hypothetical protein